MKPKIRHLMGSHPKLERFKFTTGIQLAHANFGCPLYPSKTAR